MERDEMTKGIMMHWLGADRNTRNCIMRYFVDISDDETLSRLHVFTDHIG